MIKVIMFDFDGTIADSFGQMLEVFEKLVPQQQKLTPEQIKELRDMTYSQILSFLGISFLKVPSLVIKGRHMLKKGIDKVEPFEGMIEVLAILKQSGYRMAILSSNSTQNIQKFLDEHQLAPYFTAVRGGVGLLGKPTVIRSMAKKLKCAVSEVVYVGDEPRDIDAAHKARVHSIAVTWGFIGEKVLKTHKPQQIVSTPHELLAAVAALG